MLADELEALEITSGPWEHVHCQRSEYAHWDFVRSRSAVVENDRGPNYYIQIGSDEDYETKTADHAFMVLVRNNLPQIIAALRAQETNHILGALSEPG